MEQALQEIGNLKLEAVKEPKVVDKGAGSLTWDALPLKELSRRARGMTIWVERVILNDSSFDLTTLTPLLESRRFSELPPPFNCLGPLGEFKLQLQVTSTASGEMQILKCYMMEEPLAVWDINKIKRGEVYALDWGASRMDTRLSFHWIWEQLGGYQYAPFVLMPKNLPARSSPSAAGREKELLTEEQVDAGYDWIYDKARHLTGLPLQRWIKKQMNDTSSPVFGWPKTDILDAVRALQKDNEGASVQTQYPLTLLDVSPAALQILTLLVPLLLSTSLIMLGERGVGKTALATILAMAFSRYHIRKSDLGEQPSFRLTQDLDFLRNSAGRFWQPIIYDDGDFKMGSPAIYIYI